MHSLWVILTPSVCMSFKTFEILVMCITIIITDLHGDGEEENMEKSKGEKRSQFFPYALLKPPIPGAKANTLQTEPRAGVLGQRNGQDSTTAMAGHDSPAWQAERGTGKALTLGGDWEH